MTLELWIHDVLITAQQTSTVPTACIIDSNLKFQNNLSQGGLLTMTGRYLSFTRTPNTSNTQHPKPKPFDDNRHTTEQHPPRRATGIPMKSIFAYSILFLTTFLNCKIVEGKQNEGYDLDSDAPIRIGVKNRIKDKDCK